jgi:hypothetical protein
MIHLTSKTPKKLRNIKNIYSKTLRKYKNSCGITQSSINLTKQSKKSFKVEIKAKSQFLKSTNFSSHNQWLSWQTFPRTARKKMLVAVASL